VTPPRKIDKDQHCFITVRAIGRSFRFVPTRQVVALIWYCLAVMLAKFTGKIAIHEFFFMSNHFHMMLTDISGELPKIIQDFNSILSRSLNALRGRRGKNIEEHYNIVQVHSPEKFIEHCVYTLGNAVEADLVARARHWKGVSSLDLEYGVPIEIPRPKLGLWAEKLLMRGRRSAWRSKRARYAGRWSLPEKVTLTLTRPDIEPHLSDKALRQEIRDRLDKAELTFMKERKAQGRRVLGWRKVVAQHFLTEPSSGEDMFGRVPTFSADNKWARIEAAQRHKEFIRLYRKAREVFRKGVRDAVFPEGTWLLRQRYNVPCCPLAG
jgi:REP element-mobilizing transposase RayT